MAIKFCPKCRILLIPKKIKGKFILICNNCDFSKELRKGLITKNKIKKTATKGKGVMKDKNIFANYKHKCAKCGYDKAQILDLGIFYSDEDNLILLQCGRCGYSERVGRKTS